MAKTKAPVEAARGRLMTVMETSAFLGGLGETHVRHLITRGELTVLRNARGRLIGIYEADARAWQEQRLSEGKQEQRKVSTGRGDAWVESALREGRFD